MIPLWIFDALGVAGRFLRRYWREGVIALACLVLVGECHAYGQAQRRAGRAEAATARARADVQRHAANEALLAQRYQAEAARVATTVTRYVPQRDSVRRAADSLLAHPSDSAVASALPAFRALVIEQGRALDAADTVIAACQLARLTCEQRAQAADSVAAALRAQLAAVADGTRTARPSPIARAGRALLWLGAGYAAGRLYPAHH